ELGIPSERRGTAVVGLLRGAKEGPTVALRADIDALPVKEEVETPFRSRNEGLMHACGHDAHVAIQLGAARLLGVMREDLAGNAKFLFQPAEEGDGGADTMVKDGCLESPRVDRVYGLHVMPDLRVGSVELKKGALCGSSATLSITVGGKGSHGAYPHLGTDAILIASNVVMSLNVLVSRFVSPLEEAVLSIGTIRGGTRSNIVADRVEMEATLRTTSAAVQEILIDRATSIVEGVAASFGGRGELRVKQGYAALVNHDEAVDEIEAVARSLVGEERIRWKEKPSMGVEDFSFFIAERTGAFYHLGCGNAEEGITAPLHSPLFRIDEACLPLGAAMQAGLVLSFLEKSAR
ncbi:MAG TPA: M20 family metallopeptidase, partial [Rectinemataceae bacterium]|nr:M20 family metallopeptidase [Rectinemataceae bacterium]